MANSHIEVYIHLIWATSNRQPLISEDIEKQLYDSIRAKCRELQSHLIAIGGTRNHIHLLIRLPSTVPLAKILGEVKGSSGHFVTHVLQKPVFKWQNGSGAFSVSPREMGMLINYIENQKQHHSEKTFRLEWEKIENDE